MLLSYRPLIWFWGGVAWVLVVGASTLQLLGPPPHTARKLPTPVVSATPPELPPASHVDQAPPMIPVLSAKEAVTAPATPVVSEPSQPPHTLVRKSPIPARTPKLHEDRETTAVAERTPFRQAAAPPAPIRPEQATGFDRAAGYIGVFTTGADGTRTFKAMP